MSKSFPVGTKVYYDGKDDCVLLAQAGEGEVVSLDFWAFPDVLPGCSLVRFDHTFIPDLVQEIDNDHLTEI